MNAGVLAAVNVPGGGRAQTFDLTLLGTCWLGDEPTVALRQQKTMVFLREMEGRGKRGVEHGWI